MATRERRTRGKPEVDTGRRAFLKNAGLLAAGVVWTVSDGSLQGRSLSALAAAGRAPGGCAFVQISDSHIGFHRPPNQNPTATLRETVARINALPARPDFIVHTGDASDLTKPEQYDTLDITSGHSLDHDLRRGDIDIVIVQTGPLDCCALDSH
jgi:hypothetical protein